MVLNKATHLQASVYTFLSKLLVMMYKREAWYPSLSFFYRNYHMRFFLILSLFFGLNACSGTTTSSEKKGPGSILTGRAEQGISLKDIAGIGNNSNSVGLPINALLWRASLDVMSTIPLDDVDTFGGTIVTEWYQLNKTSDERIKMTAFVLDRELRADGIRVVVYVQKRIENNWQDSGTDSQMGKQIEELILTRAREIRASGNIETTN